MKKRSLRDLHGNKITQAQIDKQMSYGVKVPENTFAQRLEAATAKFEKAVDEVVNQLKGN